MPDDWVQTEDNWDGYGAPATRPEVVAAVERQRPIWQGMFQYDVIPYMDRASAEDAFDSIEWRADGSCPVFDEIERLRADLEATRQAWVNGDDSMCDDVCLIACKGPCGQGGTTDA